jgi:FtsZ-binding cell division protein ZapB
MRKMLIFLFTMSVCSVHGQDIWQSRYETLQKEFETYKNNQSNYDRQLRALRGSNAANTQALDSLRSENERLRSENANLRNEIAFRDGSYTDQVESREMKESTIIDEAFTDPVFRAFLVTHYDNNNDGAISQYEAEEIEKLDITKLRISSVEGIENIINLKTLMCSTNKLTSLNLSNNTLLETLICDGNIISSLDISQCTELFFLDCSRNRLEKLDISLNPKLEIVNCADNILAEFISGNLELRTLNCANNRLTTLRLIDSPWLEYLNCIGNLIAVIDVSDCIYLQKMECQRNAITALDVSSNNSLTELNCSFNRLAFLSVSNDSNFDLLDCRSNPDLSEVKINREQQFIELKKGKKTILKT